MTEDEIHSALSSVKRKETLTLLYKKPYSIEELAEKLGIQPITMRHHIKALQKAGFLESFEERSGSAGRPKVYYKLAQTLPTVSFPKRQYLHFSKALINILLSELGPQKTYLVIAKTGREMGRQTMEYLETTNNIKEWTPETFAKVYVEGYLQDLGAEPEVLEQSKKKVVFRTRNCVLYELSQELPDLMCDTLHVELHKAVSEAMGKTIRVLQTNCMGHGDYCCGQSFEWMSYPVHSTPPQAKAKAN